MHAISATVLLASFVTGICAGAINPKVTRQALGTFDTFTDIGCSEGGEGITVADNNASGTLSSDVNSIKAYIPDCACKSLYYQSTIFVLRKKETELTSRFVSGYLG